MVEEKDAGKAEPVVTQEKNIQTPAETAAPKTGTDSLAGKIEEEARGEDTELDLSQAPIMPVTNAVADDKTPASPSAAPKEIPTAIIKRKARSVSHTQISSPIGSFEATVTTQDGTEMHNGDTVNLPAQDAALSNIKMKFSLLQDGNLRAGDKIRIPVTLTNNSSVNYVVALSSGTTENIAGVGTIKFDYSDPNNLAYEITLNNEFASLPKGTQKAISVTQVSSSTARLTAKSSYEKISLTINGMTFNFIPTHREFPKSEGNYANWSYAYGSEASTIVTTTSHFDPNYLNNLLASNGTDPGNTGIPTGDIITIHRITPSGSKVLNITAADTPLVDSPNLSEDGTYVVKNDNVSGLKVNNGSVKNLVLPADSTDEDIAKALKAAGPNARAFIKNTDGTYTLAYNFGQLTGSKAITYHDARPEDDVATHSDKTQEINRTDAVNEKANKILAKASVVNAYNFGMRVNYVDSSVVNSLTGQAKNYSVGDDDTIRTLSTYNLNGQTNPSNARAEGQTKITVRYVDTAGNEIASQAYQYGYPVGSTIASPSPDYDVKTKNITGYTLVKTAQPIASVAGTQLTGNTKVAFGAADKDVYFVYSVNKEKAQVRYIDDTTGATLETKELTGDYNTTDAYRTQPSIQNYQAQGYELVSDNYPSTGVTYNETLQKFEVHLKHKVTKTTESKDVKQTIRYVYEDGTKAADSKESKLTFTREVTTDAVTHQDTKGAWTATSGTSFTAVDSPVIPGFTPDQATVPAVDNVTADSSDSVVTVTYRAQSQTVVYTVIDDTTGTKLADKVALTTGPSNSTLPAAAQTQYDAILASYTSKGYGLVSRDPLPATFDNDDKVDQEVVIHVKHETEDKQETKDVSLTVRYHGAGSQTPADKVQTAQWTRTVTLDKVTGSEISATPWTADKANYDAVPSPVIPGYKVDVATVPQEAVTQDNIVKDVNYTKEVPAQDQKVVYTVIDDTTGAKLADKVALTTGPSNSALPVAAQTQYDAILASYTSKGYGLVSRDPLPATFDNDNNIDQEVVIHVKHETEDKQETKDVSLTVRYHGAGSQTPADKVQTAQWTRTVTIDKVTGSQISATPWTADKANYDAVPSPVIPGYTVDIATVPQEAVTQDNIVKDVNYTKEVPAQDQKVVYTVIDDTTGAKLADKVALTTGSSNSTLPATAQTQYDAILASYTSKGYGLVSRDPLPATFDNDNNIDQEVVIHVKHETEDKQETKDVSLTVRYHGAGSQTPADKVQTAQWTRTVTLDKVTGSEISATPWTADKANYDAVPSPVIPGYTVDIATVPQEAVTQDNIVKDVNYTKEVPAQDQKVVYTVIDDTTGTKLADKVALTTGPSNSALPAAAQTQYDNILASYTSKGYSLVSRDPLPATFDNDNNVDQEVVIHVKHETEDKQETKDVSLTVRYHGAGSQTPADKVQTAQWTRTVTLDKVTGSEISATPWTADKANYDEVKTPLVETFVADKALVAGRAVTLDNQVEDVNYAPIGHVIPVDEEGKEIPGAEHPIYPNDPTDPTKVLVTPVPEISGWTPDVKEVTPQDPTKDTPVVYRKPKPTPKPEEPNQPKTPDKPQKPEQPNKPLLPKTGDEVASSAFASLLGVGALFTAAGLVRGRKEEE